MIFRKIDDFSAWQTQTTATHTHSFTGRWEVGKTFMRGTIYLFLELAEIVCSNFAGAVAGAAAIV